MVEVGVVVMAVLEQIYSSCVYIHQNENYTDIVDWSDSMLESCQIANRRSTCVWHWELEVQDSHQNPAVVLTVHYLRSIADQGLIYHRLMLMSWHWLVLMEMGNLIG